MKLIKHEKEQEKLQKRGKVMEQEGMERKKLQRITRKKRQKEK